MRRTFEIMREHDISQLPIMDNGNIVGAVTESKILSYMLENPYTNTEKPVESIMSESFPIVDNSLSFRLLGKYFDRKIPAVIAKDRAGMYHILTQYDVIQAI